MAIDASLWKRITSGHDIPPYSILTKTIEKSPQDDREYRIIKLENGLEAMLVHDAKADKAAASLDVAVGHLSDPDDIPGMAHFCEHLLFMGTENFPKENEYSKYLAKNNGYCNAYTSDSNTNYYFDVSTSHLSGALARFAAFFHCPLFSPSCTSRELNAVDSEHRKNDQADLRRVFQVNKHLSKEGHPWNKFGSGNRESLSKHAKELKAKGKLAANGMLDLDSESATPQVLPSPIPSRMASPAPSDVSTASELGNEADGGAVGRETRRRLVEWWEKEYCAGRMHLCVIGKDSLDHLSELVSTLFSPIPNHGLDPLPTISDHPFGPNEKGTLISVQTIMNLHVLEIFIPLEPQANNWRHKPANFLAHLIGHEGPGSLLSFLKAKGLVASLNSGPLELGRGFDVFVVVIELTQEGFRNYQSVILATFKHFNLLRSQLSFDAYHQREIATLSSIWFRFIEKQRPDNYATYIAENMAKPYPRELLLVAPSVTWNWGGTAGEEKVKEYLQGFQIDNSRVVLMGKEQELDKVKQFNNTIEKWQEEPWYRTKYRVVHFPEEFIKCSNSTSTTPELFLPQPNQFIPQNLNVDKKDITTPLCRPHLIYDTSLCQVWHKKDDHFWVPKAHVVIDICSPFANSTSQATLLTQLFTDLITDSLTEFSYDASLAGLSYSCTSHSKGVYIALQGYNDKMHVLVRQVLDKVKNLVVIPDRLDIMKEQTKKNLENFFLIQSHELADYYTFYLMSETAWTAEELLKELPSITVEEVQKHGLYLLSQVHMNILVMGNVTQDQAVEIAELAENIVGNLKDGLQPSDLNEYALVLPPGSNFVYSTDVGNPDQTNNAITYYTHIGPVNDQHLHVVSSLLTQIMTEPTFNILRTKEQLGYIVSCGGILLPGSTLKGIAIVIQSEKTPGYLESRVDAFLDYMKNMIEEMSEEAFTEQKAGLEKRWREDYKNLSEEANAYYWYIDSGSWDFYRRENDAEKLKDVTKDEVMKCFMEYVHPSSQTRAKLSVHLHAKKSPPKKVSVAAAEAFGKLVQDANLGLNGVVPDGALADDIPLVDNFQAYWDGVFKTVGKEDITSSLLEAIPGLVEKYPLEGEGRDGPIEGATYIEDPLAFRRSLKKSDYYPPVVIWQDNLIDMGR
ncbi:insulin-degrading enzyme [Moniliophthora roreri MCA 2997]|uniref:Insulin-degrading enzyme n=1 Tax=Moniliophthora roreri (strain MCA 2997) TaxID=1381753 RepID=V2WRF5_MONRO|nr:insulin-degrading enzyme [Moniliophthora roreri MCA 2997]